MYQNAKIWCCPVVHTNHWMGLLGVLWQDSSPCPVTFVQQIASNWCHFADGKWSSLAAHHSSCSSHPATLLQRVAQTFRHQFEFQLLNGYQLAGTLSSWGLWRVLGEWSWRMLARVTGDDADIYWCNIRTTLSNIIWTECNSEWLWVAISCAFLWTLRHKALPRATRTPFSAPPFWVRTDTKNPPP